MADELNRLKEQLRQQAEAWIRNVDVQSDKVVSFVNDSTRDIRKTIEEERRKMELRSEIGEHRRALNKAYMRLGEAYYESRKNGVREFEDADLMDLIQNKRRLIELLEAQLSAIEKR